MEQRNNEVWIELPTLENGKPVLRIRIPPNPQEEDEADAFSDDGSDGEVETLDDKFYEEMSRLYNRNIWDWLNEIDLNWINSVTVEEKKTWMWTKLVIHAPNNIYNELCNDPIMYSKIIDYVRGNDPFVIVVITNK